MYTVLQLLQRIAEELQDLRVSKLYSWGRPSHVFFMLGMWQESIQSNRAVLAIAKAYVQPEISWFTRTCRGRRMVGQSAL
jgi:hypothetical protein